MYVQDLVKPEVNVCAEFSKEAANGFQQMCRMFANEKICEQLAKIAHDHHHFIAQQIHINSNNHVIQDED